MTSRALRLWTAVHKWTSLVCTAFLLMLCVTGLPLIFHHEIDEALSTYEWAPANPDGPLLDLDTMLAKALERRPGEVPLYMSFDVDRPVVNVTTAPTPDAADSQMHFASFDRTSGDFVPPHHGDAGVMDFILQLHTDMFLGLPGMLFLGAMGLAFAVAVVSGVVLYAPFMRKLDFGVVRASRSNRVKWLDYHNLFGVVTAAWVLVVGLTGVVNTLAVPIIDYWRNTELAALTGAQAGGDVPTKLSSLHAAVEQAEKAAPGMELQFVAFPGGSYSTHGHYAVFFHGATPLTQHLIAPALIDARTGELTAMSDMPWYAKALGLSQPLHFGDYGGLPLKILWAILDLITIVVLGSGLYLWLGRKKASAADRLPTAAALAPAE